MYVDDMYENDNIYNNSKIVIGDNINKCEIKKEWKIENVFVSSFAILSKVEQKRVKQISKG